MIKAPSAFLFLLVVSIFVVPAHCLFAANLTIGNYQLVSSTRVGRTSWDYTYTASITNSGGVTAKGVAASASCSVAGVTLVDAGLVFGDVPGGATVKSTDTFTILVDRASGGVPSLTWAITFQNVEQPVVTRTVATSTVYPTGGTVQVTDTMSLLVGTKLIVPPGATTGAPQITISEAFNPAPLPSGYAQIGTMISLGPKDTQFSVPVTLSCPINQGLLSDFGLNGPGDLRLFTLDPSSNSWVEVTPVFVDTINKVITVPLNHFSLYAWLGLIPVQPPADLGPVPPQPGDLIYKTGNIFIDWFPQLQNILPKDQWVPGHVGIYVGEETGYVGCQNCPYNVIEALWPSVARSYYPDIRNFGGTDGIYMGARQPKSGPLTDSQRDAVVGFVEAQVGKPYALPATRLQFLDGMLSTEAWFMGPIGLSYTFFLAPSSVIKGPTQFNCVGLAEAAYETAGVNEGVGLVSTAAENSGFGLTPLEQYANTVPSGSPPVSPNTVTEFSAGITASADINAITAGPDGNLWFTEYSGSRIGRITPSGVVTEFSAGITDGYPFSITAGPDGNVWFAEWGYSGYGTHIGRITPPGDITEFSVGTTPWGITAGPDGNLWVSWFDGIARVTPGGVVTDFSILHSFEYPSSITAGPDGNLWYTMAGYGFAGLIGRITPAGVITEFGASSSYLGDITAGPDGNIWFTCSGNQIGRITPAGVVTLFSAGISANANLSSITAGPDGNLWFTEPGVNQIGRITPFGVVTEFGAGISAGASPSSITAGPDGNIWFTEPGVNRIGRITPR